jgi:isopentenyl-diphosphate Delta-isomerase
MDAVKKDKTNSPEEILDLVNIKDKVIGEIAKGKANSDPSVIHREIAIIVYDRNNKILIQKRSMKKVVDPGLWTISVAGHIPRGMLPEKAAHMELKEELGFDTKLEFINKKLIHYENETHFAYLFKGLYNGQKIKIEKAEVDQVKFISRKDFKIMQNAGEEFEPHSVIRMNSFWNTY